MTSETRNNRGLPWRAVLLVSIVAVAFLASPAHPASAATAAAISTGGPNCALTTEGGVKCWGVTPVGVAELATGVAAVSAGGSHTCALTTAGGLKCWGSGFDGQLGDGGQAPRTTPVDVVGLTSGVAAVSAGQFHTCAVTTAGGLKCWGRNFDRQLGDGSFTFSRTTPVDVVGLTTGVAAVSAGSVHTCAVTTGSGLKCWGDNTFGQLGPSVPNPTNTPVDVVGLSSGVAAVSAGGGHTCALTTAGGVKCLGLNDDGQLGDGTTTRRVTPVDVIGLTSGVAAVSAGSQHTCALTTVGGLKCWGRNFFGQVGDGTTTRQNRTTPVDVIGLTGGVAAVSAGGSRTCALTTAGGLKCWGSGPLGDGTTTTSATPVDVSGFLGADVADLSIEKSASAGLVAVDDRLTYTIKVTNNGPATSTVVTLIDTLPSGVGSSPSHPHRPVVRNQVAQSPVTLETWALVPWLRAPSWSSPRQPGQLPTLLR